MRSRWRWLARAAQRVPVRVRLVMTTLRHRASSGPRRNLVSGWRRGAGERVGAGGGHCRVDLKIDAEVRHVPVQANQRFPWGLVVASDGEVGAPGSDDAGLWVHRPHGCTVTCARPRRSRRLGLARELAAAEMWRGSGGSDPVRPRDPARAGAGARSLRRRIGLSDLGRGSSERDERRYWYRDDRCRTDDTPRPPEGNT